jgi:molecular chaperone DnaK (HSP70)
MVQSMLSQLAGKAPSRSLSPDEAVSFGAAFHASILLGAGAPIHHKFSIKNVASHSLGVIARNAKTDRDENVTLIPRNTSLPATARRNFRPQRSSQRSLLVRIVEGEHASPASCSEVGKCVVRNLPPGLPADTAIEVRFIHQANGRIQVEVFVAGTDRALVFTLTRASTLTQEQLDSWRSYISQGLAAAPIKEGSSPTNWLPEDGSLPTDYWPPRL